ncbi:hypothetical protein EJ02DRAFT_496281, partial [Clathrospora elynae]
MQLQQQKAEAAKVQKSNQQLKARLIQERRVERAEARVVKAKEKADLVAKRTGNQRVQQAKKQLQARIKLSKNSSKQGLKTTKRTKTVVEAGGSGRTEDAVLLPLPPQSRSGRCINTPSRFK